MVYQFLICFLSGIGAGLGTGFAGMSAAVVISPMPVSYTHLDVYKRQLQEALRDKHRHIHILNAYFFETGIQILLDVFPNGITIWLNDHTAFNAGVILSLIHICNSRW